MHAEKAGELRATNISRRKFLLNSGLLLGCMVPYTKNPFLADIPFHTRKAIDKLSGPISNLPNFCTHKHRGSIESIGQAPEQRGFRCDPDMDIVMIHCWPFFKEAAFLAKLIPNIHVDTCWLPVLNPEFLKEAFNTWFNYVPTHKIMLGHDSTHVEMAAGSSLFTREILTESLVAQQKKLKMSDASIVDTAADMLQNNAVRLYKIGKLTK